MNYFITIIINIIIIIRDPYKILCIYRHADDSVVIN